MNPDRHEFSILNFLAWLVFTLLGVLFLVFIEGASWVWGFVVLAITLFAARPTHKGGTWAWHREVHDRDEEYTS